MSIPIRRAPADSIRKVQGALCTVQGAGARCGGAGCEVLGARCWMWCAGATAAVTRMSCGNWITHVLSSVVLFVPVVQKKGPRERAFRGQPGSPALYGTCRKFRRPALNCTQGPYRLSDRCIFERSWSRRPRDRRVELSTFAAKITGRDRSALEATRATPGSNHRAFGILKGQFQLLGELIDRRSGSLPRAVGLEAQIADAAAPRRDHAADRAEVGAVGVLLIEPADDVGRDADEGAQRRRRLDAVLAAVPRGAEDDRDLPEIVDEEALALPRETRRPSCRCRTRRSRTASSVPARAAPARRGRARRRAA